MSWQQVLPMSWHWTGAVCAPFAKKVGFSEENAGRIFIFRFGPVALAGDSGRAEGQQDQGERGQSHRDDQRGGRRVRGQDVSAVEWCPEEWIALAGYGL